MLKNTTFITNTYQSTMKQIVVAGGLLSILAMPLSANASEGTHCFPMGGVGNYNYADDVSGVAAMNGDFGGGVYFKQVKDFRDVGNGRVEAEFEHMFVTVDGSTIKTRDVSWGIPVKGTDYIVGGAAYTVVEATGKFKGYSGTFNSWGTFVPSKGKAVLRYEGKVCKN